MKLDYEPEIAVRKEARCICKILEGELRIETSNFGEPDLKK